jgi:hypothetical protein
MVTVCRACASNDLAIADLEGDGHPEIIAVGRRGSLHDRVHFDQRREVGDLSILSFSRDELTTRSRFAWSKSTALRLRAVVVGDLGDGHPSIVAGGEYGADGKPCLGRFTFERGALALQSDATPPPQDGMTGEIKDLVLVGHGPNARVLATGIAGDAYRHHGDVIAWRPQAGALVLDASVASRADADMTGVRRPRPPAATSDTRPARHGHHDRIGHILLPGKVVEALGGPECVDDAPARP